MAVLEHINGYWTGNQYLTEDQMIENATWIYNYLINLPGTQAWKHVAICCFLGNVQQESTINPGIWQDLTQTIKDGYGLTQWTPSTKYTDWCKKERISPQYMDSALKRVQWECDNEGKGADQWYPTSKYPYTFYEFTQADDANISKWTECFMRCYERPAEEHANLFGRTNNSRYWHLYFRGLDPGPMPDPTPEHGRRFKWWMYMGRPNQRGVRR